jgi:hypothetical protein
MYIDGEVLQMASVSDPQKLVYKLIRSGRTEAIPNSTVLILSVERTVHSFSFHTGTTFG